MNQAEVRRKQIEAVCRVIGVAVLLIFGKKLHQNTAYSNFIVEASIETRQTSIKVS